VQIGSGRAIRVVTGQSHTCVLFEGGSVRCWGENQRGQLGLAGLERIGDDEHPFEAPLLRLSGPAVDIAAGYQHTCVLLEGGGVQCWGSNEFGQLGLGHVETIGDDEHPADAELVQVR
jgi:alpha-tubulin suppressor-like RCC1 family protein